MILQFLHEALGAGIGSINQVALLTGGGGYHLPALVGDTRPECAEVTVV